MSDLHDRNRFFKELPAVWEFFEHPRLFPLLSQLPRALLQNMIDDTLRQVRREIAAETFRVEQLPDLDALVESVTRRGEKLLGQQLERVINASGIIIHTNLGRAPIAAVAWDNIRDAVIHYSDLEFATDQKKRGDRLTRLARLMQEIFGVEDALVVNNNAAAVLLALTSLAKGREVIISRGELVEIGGAFRIPEVMEQSGCKLREVGTTNQTHLRDYEAAITPETALILKVHQSNYRIIGFTAEVPLLDLVRLGQKRGIPVMYDVGSAALFPLSQARLPGSEPSVAEILQSGVDALSFSGDKLFGGPQAGILLGRAKYLQPMRRNPLYRALRVDKITIALLIELFKLSLDEPRAIRAIPVLRMLTEPLETITTRAMAAITKIQCSYPTEIQLTKQPGLSYTGGGALPELAIPTILVAVSIAGIQAARIDILLRQFQPPIIGRIENDMFLLDFRTIQDDDVEIMVKHFGNLLKNLGY